MKVQVWTTISMIFITSYGIAQNNIGISFNALTSIYGEVDLQFEVATKKELSYYVNLNYEPSVKLNQFSGEMDTLGSIILPLSETFTASAFEFSVGVLKFRGENKEKNYGFFYGGHIFYRKEFNPEEGLNPERLDSNYSLGFNLGYRYMIMGHLFLELSSTCRIGFSTSEIGNGWDSDIHLPYIRIGYYFNSIEEDTRRRRSSRSRSGRR